jgi:hypothetical protein
MSAPIESPRVNLPEFTQAGSYGAGPSSVPQSALKLTAENVETSRAMSIVAKSVLLNVKNGHTGRGGNTGKLPRFPRFPR